MSRTCCSCTRPPSTINSSRRQVGARDDIAGQQLGAQEIERLADQLVEVERLHLHVAALVQRAEAANDLGCPIVLGHDIVADLPQLGEIDAVPAQHFSGRFGIAEDRRERLVQLVGDRGGKLSQHRYAGHVPQRGAVFHRSQFGQLALGDVDRDTEHVLAVALLRPSARGDPAHCAILLP